MIGRGEYGCSIILNLCANLFVATESWLRVDVRSTEGNRTAMLNTDWTGARDPVVNVLQLSTSIQEDALNVLWCHRVNIDLRKPSEDHPFTTTDSACKVQQRRALHDLVDFWWCRPS
mmetsp:Transcript_62737/g.168119  ORF Transcript_62737/g.168119 Transcript_62737/m.168119 type:complete len:117 (-) Transcript_62737:39-389(-)